MSVKRNILLNPGPATTTDTVKASLMAPDMCHREQDFVDVIEKLRIDLVKIAHGNENDHVAVLFSGSGTINMDVSLNSLLPEGKKVLIINNGAYSSRAVDIANYYGLAYVELKSDFACPINVDDVKKSFADNDDIALVYTTHHETGSGILNDIRSIGHIVHEHNAVFVADTTSSFALVPIDIVKDNVDFILASAQKGIAAMPGLSFIIGKRHLIEKSKDYPKRSYYTNLYRQYYHFEYNGEMQFTPPVQLVYAASQGVKEYFLEGEENKHNRIIRINQAIHDGLKRLGFKETIKRENQGPLVVSALYPNDSHWNFKKVHDYVYERGFILFPRPVGGVQAFRVGSLGAIDVTDIERFFIVLQEALLSLKIEVPVRY
jgi:2-aminoethylphosphonate-pyruvate transaminase